MLCLHRASLTMISKHLSDQKKRILFFTPWYPHRYDSMLGLFVQRHAETLADDYRVSVIYLHADSQMQNRKFELGITDHKGVEEIRVYYQKTTSAVLNVSRYFRAFLVAWKYYQKTNGKPDISHVHVLTRAGLWAWWLKMRYGIPYIITEHWSRYLPEKNTYHGFLRKMLTKRVVSNAAAVSAVSLRLMNAMKKQGLKHPCYKPLYNLVDTDLFQPATNDGREKTRFIHVSCFEDRSKNISGIISAAQKLKQQGLDFELMMVGDGIDFGLLKKKAEEYNLQEQVFFSGVLEGEELAEEFRKSDFQLLFSNYETFGIVVYEGFAAGVPVICTKTADLPAHISEDMGFLVEVGDTEALSQRMAQCILDKPVFNSNKLRSFVQENFSREAVKKQLEELYRIALNEEEC